jgi:hypothetical protein
MAGWKLMKPMLVVNWCGQGQEFILVPEADGYWTLVPIIDALTKPRNAPAHGLPQDLGVAAIDGGSQALVISPPIQHVSQYRPS